MRRPEDFSLQAMKKTTLLLILATLLPLATLHAGATAAAIAQCFGKRGNTALKEFQAALEVTEPEADEGRQIRSAR